MQDGRPQIPPDYERVVRLLTDAELEDEILGRRGSHDFQAACLKEADRRGEQVPS